VTAAPNLTNLPPKEAFVEPYKRIALWDYPQHPNVQKVLRDARVLIGQLEFVAESEVGITAAVADSEQAAAERQERADERALELIQFMRDLHFQLTSGLSFHRVRRDVKRLVPHLLPHLDRATDAAIDQIVEMRAALAFFIGANDDADLGVELLPPTSH
jgi:hypothetical protein